MKAKSLRAFPPEPTTSTGAVITYDLSPSQKWLDAQSTEYLRQCLPGLTGMRRTTILGELAARAAVRFVSEDRAGFFKTIREFLGYSADPFEAIYRPLPLWRLINEVQRLPLLEGHAYRVYLIYKAEDGQRTFKRLEAIDADALTGPSGPAVKLGEITL
jgi:hypothetical protein